MLTLSSSPILDTSALDRAGFAPGTLRHYRQAINAMRAAGANV